jgi:hypothetical protein
MDGWMWVGDMDGWMDGRHVIDLWKDFSLAQKREFEDLPHVCLHFEDLPSFSLSSIIRDIFFSLVMICPRR